MLFFSNEKEYKDVVSGLRRELKALGFDLAGLGHNRMLELVARSMGHTSYAAMRAAQPAAVPTKVEAPKPSARQVYMTYAHDEEAVFLAELEQYQGYRLLNTGQLDLCTDEEATPVHGLTMAGMEGTLEDIWNCTCATNGASRNEYGTLDAHHGGETDVNWDGQKTRCDTRGVELWVDGNCNAVPADTLVLVPEGCEDLNLLSEEALDNEGIVLKPREELVDACYRWLVDNQLVAAALEELVWDEGWGGFGDGFAEKADAMGSPRNAKASVLGKAQWVAGFAMHVHEFKALREQLLAVSA